MKATCILLALAISVGYEATVAHIVTSSQVDYPLLHCMKSLRNVINVLCNNYARSDEVYESGIPSIPREMAREANWELLEKTCCLQPCTVSELLSMC